MQKLLTIVVPVYKVEQYINKCLDSCIIYRADGSLDEEKMGQLEVIIVNDGTPDRSAEMSREYTVRYPQTFRQIDQENRGHGGAWNTGLKEATGKYLRFLDSDDWLTNLDKLMSLLATTNVDLICNHRYDYFVETQSKELKENFGKYNEIIDVQKIEPYSFADHIGMVNFWTTTYKTSLLQPLYPLFKEHIRYDDSILFTIPIIKASNYMLIDYPVYNYLLGRNGQSVDNYQIRLHIDERVIAYKYLYERTIKENKGTDLPYAVNHAIIGQLLLLMDLCSRYTYKDCKRLRLIIPSYVPHNNEELNKSKVYNRYLKLPLPLFYFIQKLRIVLGSNELYRKLRNLN